jgi:hypothetical protein
VTGQLLAPRVKLRALIGTTEEDWVVQMTRGCYHHAMVRHLIHAKIVRKGRMHSLMVQTDRGGKYSVFPRVDTGFN